MRMLLIATVAERRIRAAWGTAPLGRNLPDALREVDDLIPRGLLPIMAALVIITGYLLILVDAPPVILLGLAVLVFAGALQVTVRALRAANRDRTRRVAASGRS